MNNIDITSAIEALIALFAAIITVFLIPWIKSKTTAAQREEIEAWVGIAVFAAEQLFAGNGRGEEKKAYVLNYLSKKGFTVDKKSLDLMIESTVKAMNEEYHKKEG